MNVCLIEGFLIFNSVRYHFTYVTCTMMYVVSHIHTYCHIVRALKWMSFFPTKHRHPLASRLFPAVTLPEVSRHYTLQSLRITTRSSAINPHAPSSLFSVSVWRTSSPSADLNVTSSLEVTNKNYAIVNWHIWPCGNRAPSDDTRKWTGRCASLWSGGVSVQRFVDCLVCAENCADCQRVKQEGNLIDTHIFLRNAGVRLLYYTES